jgi:flagellar biogenesis protein FliO
VSVFAADAHVTGLPAALIILLILAIFVAGAYTLVRLTARGAKKMTGTQDDGPRRREG